MRKYEAIYILPAALTENEVQSVADNYKGIVEKNGGKVESAALWEKRKLAYEIAGHREGNYVIMNFESEPQVPAELSRLMRINDTIVRHRIFSVEDNA